MEDRVLIEVCLESVESVLEAQKGGADRVELCSDLFEGGLTPTIGTLKTAKKLSSIKINCMIRPRGGDFCYSDYEFEVMKQDLLALKEVGADGFVFGILKPNGTIDEKRTKELIDLARPLPVTFHRAFDMVPDADAALETLIKLGVDRVLTSGQEATVLEGMFNLKHLVQKAGERIIVMPGCGITTRNFEYLKSNIGAKEYHVFLQKEQSSQMSYRPEHIYMGGMLRQTEFAIAHTDSEKVNFVVNVK